MDLLVLSVFEDEGGQRQLWDGHSHDLALLTFFFAIHLLFLLPLRRTAL
jgi:hypothetical protein